MKISKTLITGLLILFSLAALADDSDIKPVDRGWTIFRFCFTKGAPALCEKENVYGINIGIPESYNYNCVQKIHGFDWGFVSTDSRVSGMQFGMTNWSKGSSGFQLAFANLVEDFGGVQMAAANYTRNSCALQLGLFNFARKESTGVQIGLLNFMDEGFLPCFPLVNISF
jgi:hypothetical protein